MKTIVILIRRADTSDEALARLVVSEAGAVWQGFAMVCVRAAHGLLEGSGAVLELETATAEEATHFVETLPYVAHKLLDVQYYALKPFPGFMSLAK